jgi:predicted PurR-regulated permease PerM
MNVHIDIDTRTFVRFWLVVIGFVVAALAIYSASAALAIIGSALFLAIALSPPVNYLAKTLPSNSRVTSTAISYLAVLTFLGVIIFLVIPPIVEQTAKLAQTIPALIDSATEQQSSINQFINNYNLRDQANSIIDSIKSSSSKIASGMGSELIVGIGSVFSIITSGILVIVLAFLMLVEGPDWLNKLWSIYNDKSRMEFHRNILIRMYTVVTSYVIGQLSVSAIAGVVAGAAVFVLSLIFTEIPLNLVIPTIAIVFVLSLIPMFGAMIGAAIMSVILGLNNISAAVFFLIFFILYQQVEANYISPKIQSKRINLSALAILIAVTIGLYLFGIAGGIISIPVAGCINILAEDYFARVRKKYPNKKNGVLIKKVEVDV